MGIRRCSKSLGLPSPNVNDCNPLATTTPMPTTTTSSAAFFKLLMVAGNSDGTRLDDTELFNPYTEDNNCAKPQSYPLKVESLCGSETTFCGGFVDGVDFVDQCHEFKDGSWEASGVLNHVRQSCSCMRLSNGSFWVAGGSDFNNILDSAEIKINEDSAFSETTTLP